MKRKYSIILGNLGNTCDRFCRGYKSNPDTVVMLKQAAAIPHVSGIELVGTWDVRPDNSRDMKKMLDDHELACVSIIPDIFSDSSYGKGSYSSIDRAIRQKAVDYTKAMCDVAGELNCTVMNLWPGQDGYDYLLATDYEKQREWMCEAITKLASEYPHLSFALEYKPQEPRTHSCLARMADTLLLVKEINKDNVGVTLDTGHAFAAGENVSESIVLARRAGNHLLHMHFNDNHGSWDDDMIVGTVHSVCYLEMLYWLDRCEYDGWFSMDQYPYREDAVGALTESIQWLIKFDTILEEHRSTIDSLIAMQDAVETSRFLRTVLV